MSTPNTSAPTSPSPSSSSCPPPSHPSLSRPFPSSAATTTSTTTAVIPAGAPVVIQVLGRSFEVLNTMDTTMGELLVLVITIQILGYNRRMAMTSITVPSSSPVFFRRYSRTSQPIGQLIPLEQVYSRVSMQEELD